MAHSKEMQEAIKAYKIQRAKSPLAKLSKPELQAHNRRERLKADKVSRGSRQAATMASKRARGI
jgi:hypothetical protein